MKPRTKTQRALVFGVFDLLHPGHLYLLYHARREAQELVAVVARDAAVKRLKGRAPAWDEKRRSRAVRATGFATAVALGDAREGSYRVLARYRPNMICLGYDQKKLKDDLMRAMKEKQVPHAHIKTLRAYQPQRFKTSRLRRNS